MHVQCTCICTYAYEFYNCAMCMKNLWNDDITQPCCVCTILYTWFLSLSIRILHRLKNLSLKKKISSNFSQHKIQKPLKNPLNNEKFFLDITNTIFFLPSKYFLDMFHVHLLYTIREIQIYITDYMHCRLALFYIWQMTRVR